MTQTSTEVRVPAPRFRFRRDPHYVSQHDPNQCASHKRYLLDCRQFDQIRDETGSACQICRTPEIETNYRRLAIDHDPDLGFWAVRGLLCPKCNTALGRNLLDPAVAAAYLADPWHVRAGRNYLPVSVPEIPLVTAADALDLLAMAKQGYRSAEENEDGQVRAAASGALTYAVRVATKAGIRQSVIVRAIDHIWTRELVSYRLMVGGRWVVENLYKTAGGHTHPRPALTPADSREDNLMTIIPKPGDEILIRGQVLEHVPGVGARVELFSKTDQYEAWIAEDRIADVILPDVPPEPDDGTWLAGSTGFGPQVWYRRDSSAPEMPDRRWPQRWFDVAGQAWIDWPEVVKRGGDPVAVLHIGHHVLAAATEGNAA